MIIMPDDASLLDEMEVICRQRGERMTRQYQAVPAGGRRTAALCYALRDLE